MLLLMGKGVDVSSLLLYAVQIVAVKMIVNYAGIKHSSGQNKTLLFDLL